MKTRVSVFISKDLRYVDIVIETNYPFQQYLTVRVFAYHLTHYQCSVVAVPNVVAAVPVL